jgi:hypothetical protein
MMTKALITGFPRMSSATARSRGNDTILDALLLRLPSETARRRGGALAIRVDDLNPDRS